METIEQTVGIKTITIKNEKSWEPEEIKQLRQQQKKAHRKELNDAIKNHPEKKEPYQFLTLNNRIIACERDRSCINP